MEKDTVKKESVEVVAPAVVAPTQEAYDGLVKENEELKKQIENIIKRYKKLSMLYNDTIEKFLSGE